MRANRLIAVGAVLLGAIHPVFFRMDGGPVVDFTIDRSKC